MRRKYAAAAAAAAAADVTIAADQRLIACHLFIQPVTLTWLSHCLLQHLHRASSGATTQQPQAIPTSDLLSARSTPASSGGSGYTCGADIAAARSRRMLTKKATVFGGRLTEESVSKRTGV
jgi:hypothetical protein